MEDVLSKDMIIREIIPYLPVAKRGNKCDTGLLVSVVQLILYRLETGNQWRMLPVKAFISQPYDWRTVFYHYNRWCRHGVWKKAWQSVLAKNRSLLQLRTAQLDGTQTVCKKGGQRVGYQKRKAANSTNMPCISDERGVILAASGPIGGNHHDVHGIVHHFERLVIMPKAIGINVQGLILNADAAFDRKELRAMCTKYDIAANFDLNPRNGSLADREDYFDPVFYKVRRVIEHAFAWLDGYKALMVRYETTARNWMNLNFIGFMSVFLKRTNKC